LLNGTQETLSCFYYFAAIRNNAVKTVQHALSIAVAEFFENLVFEAKIDANKGDMIKYSLQSRKALHRRVKTTMFDDSTKSKFQGIINIRYF
jgi:hypothetical protein